MSRNPADLLKGGQTAASKAQEQANAGIGVKGAYAAGFLAAERDEPVDSDSCCCPCISCCEQHQSAKHAKRDEPGGKREREKGRRVAREQSQGRFKSRNGTTRTRVCADMRQGQG
jgi:hypothetical protein